MAFKFLLLFVAAVGAASLQDYQQQRYAPDAQDQRNDDSVGYDFSYSVQDPITGDYKNQEESRRNGNVRGQYSWVDADGVRQIVDYQADDRNGFNSEHRREPAVRPRLNRVFQVVPATASPAYTIDTLIAPVYTSASRIDHSRSRNQDNRDGHSDDREDREERDERDNRDDRDDRDNREDRDHRDNRDGRDGRDERDGRDHRDGRDERNGRDHRDGRDHREHRAGRDEHENRDGRDHRDGRDGHDNRDSRDGRDNRDGRDGRTRSRDGRRGREGHAQSEVRFQAPAVAYQYSN